MNEFHTWIDIDIVDTEKPVRRLTYRLNIYGPLLAADMYISINDGHDARIAKVLWDPLERRQYVSLDDDRCCTEDCAYMHNILSKAGWMMLGEFTKDLDLMQETEDDEDAADANIQP